MKTQHRVPPSDFGARNRVETQQACRTDAGAADRAADPVVLATDGTVPDRWDASKGATR